MSSTAKNTRARGTASGATAASAPPAIAVEHLGKAYGAKQAVRDLSFSVQPGEIFALLGPNGAGKTTSIEILEGYRSADTGTVQVLGLDPLHDEAALKPQLGIMLQQDGVYPSLRAREVLMLFSRFFADPEDPKELLELVGLTDAANTRCRQLSGGQKRRLALALALVGKPRLVFLDEPTTGMDPQARRATWDILLDLKARGTTILLTTHFMDEAERLADRIAIIDAGELIALDTPDALTSSQSTTSTEVRFSAATGLDVRALAKFPAVRAAREDTPGHYTLDAEDAPQALVELVTYLRDKDVALTDLRVGRSSLEEVFLRLTGKEMRA